MGSGRVVENECLYNGKYHGIEYILIEAMPFPL